MKSIENPRPHVYAELPDGKRHKAAEWLSSQGLDEWANFLPIHSTPTTPTTPTNTHQGWLFPRLLAGQGRVGYFVIGLLVGFFI